MMPKSAAPGVSSVDTMDRDLTALDAHRLLPRLLRGVDQVDSTVEISGLSLDAPLLPLLFGKPTERPALVPATDLLAGGQPFTPGRVVALLPNDSMGTLIDAVRALAPLGVAAIALDLSNLADTAPYGESVWRPRSREELAELRAAAGLPLWLAGIASADDADVALEAGLDAVVVDSAAGRHIGGPAVIEVLPEVVDAVAGTMEVLAAGAVRDGIDVFRLLAVGADAVVLRGDRPLEHLQRELHHAMRLTGCGSFADIGLDAIYAPLFGEDRA